jgi:hypothetical protein
MDNIAFADEASMFASSLLCMCIALHFATVGRGGQVTIMHVELTQARTQLRNSLRQSSYVLAQMRLREAFKG